MPRAGSYEFRARGLVELGRELDRAFEDYQPRREAFAEAAQRRAKAVEELASNGASDVAK